MQNKASLIIIFILLSVALFTMFSVDQWSSDISKKGYITTGTGLTGAELYTGAVSEIKGRNSSVDYSVSEGINVPGAVAIEATNVENVAQKQSTRSGFKSVKDQYQKKSGNLGGTGNDWLAQQTNPASDFDATLKARTTEVKTNAAEPKKAKSDSKATDSKKQNGRTTDPGEPGITLPIGDGLWLLLIMLAAYAMNKRIMN